MTPSTFLTTRLDMTTRTTPVAPVIIPVAPVIIPVDQVTIPAAPVATPVDPVGPVTIPVDPVDPMDHRGAHRAVRVVHLTVAHPAESEETVAAADTPAVAASAVAADTSAAVAASAGAAGTPAVAVSAVAAEADTAESANSQPRSRFASATVTLPVNGRLHPALALRITSGIHSRAHYYQIASGPVPMTERVWRCHRLGTAGRDVRGVVGVAPRVWGVQRRRARPPTQDLLSSSASMTTMSLGPRTYVSL